MLTPKQSRFVEEYMRDSNATQAYIRAGYSERTANKAGPKLLVNLGVSAAIRKAIQERSDRTQISVDRVLTELARVALADIRDVVKWSEDGVRMVPSDMIPEDVARSIAEVSQTATGELKIKMHSKLTALHDIGKHLGMFIERHEHAILPISQWSEEQCKTALGDEAEPEGTVH